MQGSNPRYADHKETANFGEVDFVQATDGDVSHPRTFDSKAIAPPCGAQESAFDFLVSLCGVEQVSILHYS